MKLPTASRLVDELRNGWTFLYEKYGPPAEPGNSTGSRRPHNSSVFWSLTGFIVLAVTVAIAAAIAAQWTRFTVGVVGLVLMLGLTAGAIYDMWVQAPSKPSLYGSLA